MPSRGPDGKFVRERTIPWNPQSSQWDDGYTDRKGYFRVYRPDHPRADKMGYAKRYHVVWWLAHGTMPPAGIDIHHETDDRFGNLQSIGHGPHSTHHCLMLTTVICQTCHSPFQKPAWRIQNRGNKFCSLRCYHAAPKSQETRNRQSEGLRRSHAQRGHSIHV